MSKNRIVFSVGLLLMFITIFNGPPLWFKWLVVFLSGIVLVAVSLSVSVSRRSVAGENKKTKESPTVVDVVSPKAEENFENKED